MSSVYMAILQTFHKSLIFIVFAVKIKGFYNKCWGEESFVPTFNIKSIL